MSTFLFVIGLVLLVLSFLFLDQEKPKASKPLVFDGEGKTFQPAPEEEMEKVESWKKEDFQKMFDSVFREINSQGYSNPHNKYSVRYVVDVKNKKQIVLEMFKDTIIFEYVMELFPYKSSNVHALENIRAGLIYDVFTAASISIQQEFNDKKKLNKQFHERVKKLNTVEVKK